MKKINRLPVSIIIPTLGYPWLLKTINKIYQGSNLPSELIIVLPKKNYFNCSKIRITFKNKLNIKFIFSKKKNQIYQRILGFKSAKYKYILQMDDDVFLSKTALFKLYSFIKNRKKIAVAPRYVENGTNSIIYHKPKNFILKFYHFLINSFEGYSPGKIALSGFNYADESRKKGYRQIDWLSGGAVLHDKKNLVLKNYYPYKFERSICEDILHSLILRKKGIKLIKLFDAAVYAKPSSRINASNSLIKIFKNIYQEIKIRFYIVERFNLSKFYMFNYYIIFVLRIILVKIKKKLSL